ncbi:hypothetical protein BGX21_002295, partial [Mortierella sp. AD011]
SKSYLRPTQDDLIPTSMDKPEASQHSADYSAQTRSTTGLIMEGSNEHGTTSVDLAEPRPGEPISTVIHNGENSRHSGDGVYSRRIQIQALQSKITELQSSIRKARQIVQQQEKNDTPLQELIDKWKKACQEGAQVLLEKYIEQEQFFGGGEDSSSTERSKLGSYSEFNDWGYVSKTQAQDHGHLQRLRGLDAHQIEAMEDNMETQDVQYDLPTVEEAIHSRIMPELSGEYPRAMTKMKKLLMGLGIDPAIIGYNAEQDIFTSEELPYESS